MMDVQDTLLQKLAEYGEHFLETNEIKTKKKKKKKNQDQDTPSDRTDVINNDNKLDNSSNIETPKSDIKKKRKKRKKKKKVDPSNNDKNKTAKHARNPGGPERHIEQIKRELGLDNFKEEQERKLKLEEEEIEKKRLQNLKSKRQPEIVVFHSRKGKAKEEEPNAKDKDTTKEVVNGEKMDLETARHDVRKFGITGAKGKQKEEAMKDLLLKLGAKPLKKKYVNYKEYQETNKKQKEDAIAQKSWDREVGNKVYKEDKGEKRKRDRNDIGYLDGQVGRYKSGVLFLKKSDIHSIKKSKVKKL